MVSGAGNVSFSGAFGGDSWGFVRDVGCGRGLGFVGGFGCHLGFGFVTTRLPMPCFVVFDRPAADDDSEIFFLFGIFTFDESVDPDASTFETAVLRPGSGASVFCFDSG